MPAIRTGDELAADRTHSANTGSSTSSHRQNPLARNPSEGDDNGDKRKPLPRNQACLRCRTRKVRCDAGKPCGPCVKAALARNETASTIQCDYDGSAPDKQPASYSIPNTTKKPKSSSTSDRNKATLSKVGELEDKVAQLEAFIKNNGSRPVAQPDIFRSVYLENLSQKDDSPFRKATTASGTADASPSLSAEFQRTAFNKGSSGSSSSSNAHDSTHSPPGDGTSQDFTNSNQFTHLFAAAPEPTPSSETSHAVHRVGWSSDLPPPHLTRKLIDIFFTKPHSSSFLINKVRFMQDFDRPPLSSNFPGLTLLHAILAVAFTISPPNVLNISKEPYWQTSGVELPAFYHAERTKFWMDRDVENIQRVFEFAQALCLLCHFSWSHARFQELWLYTGMATRACAPLGLNHIEACILDDQQAFASKAYPNSAPLGPADNCRPGAKCVANPPLTEGERQDRASILWHAFIADRVAQANTGWACSLDEADISSLLPSAGHRSGPIDFDPFRFADSLSADSSSFFVSHPPNIVGPFQLYIKSAILLSRVIEFLQRAPWPVGSRAKMRPSGRYKAVEPLEVKNSPQFKDLDSDLVSFRLSFHRDIKALFSNFTNSAEDHHLLLALAFAHVASMFLHQTFSTRQPEDASFSRCLTSARAIVSTIHMLMFTTTFDIGLLHPFMLFTWAAAGRVLVRDAAIQKFRGNQAELNRDNTELSMLLIAIGNMKSPLAQQQREQLQSIIAAMDSALPPESLSLHSIAGISSRPEGSWVRSQQGSETGGSNGPSPAGSSESASAAYNSGLSSFTNISSNSNGSTVPEAHAIPEQSPTSTMQDLFTNPMNAPTGLSSQSAEQAPDLPEGEIDFTTFLSSTSMSLDATTYETPLPEFLGTNLHGMDWTSTSFFDNSVIYG